MATGASFEPLLLDLPAREVREGAHCAGDLADRDLSACASEASRPRANSAKCPASFTPNVVGSAWMPWERPIGGVFVLACAALEGGEKLVEVAINRSAARMSWTAKLVSSTSVDVMPHGGSVPGAHELVDVREEGDHVVLNLALDCLDAGDVEDGLGALLPDPFGGLPRHESELGQRARRMCLNLEPDAEARLGRPDRRDGGAAVAGDHRGTRVSVPRGYHAPRRASTREGGARAMRSAKGFRIWGMR